MTAVALTESSANQPEMFVAEVMSCREGEGVWGVLGSWGVEDLDNLGGP